MTGADPAVDAGTGRRDPQRPPLAATAAGDQPRESLAGPRLTARMIEYIAKAPAVWVEGQVAQLTVRAGTAIVFLTLRDPSADVSLPVTLPEVAPSPGSPGRR